MLVLVIVGSGLGLGLVNVRVNRIKLRIGTENTPVMYICPSGMENNTEHKSYRQVTDPGFVPRSYHTVFASGRSEPRVRYC